MDHTMALDLLTSVSLDLVVWRRELLDDVLTMLLRIQYSIEEDPEFIFSDLPKLGKAFDKALSDGVLYLSLDTCPLRELFVFVFDANGAVYEDADPNMILFIRQYCYMFKKVQGQCPLNYVREEVIEFHRIEEEMRHPSLNWKDDELVHNKSISFEDDNFLRVPDTLIRLFGSLADRFASNFGRLDPFEIIPRHGPGAVSDRRFGSDKYRFEDWPEKLDRVFNYDYFATSNLMADFDEVSYRNHEHPAKLIAVPKTPMKPRLIASEPAYYQYIQQGILGWIRKNLPIPLRSCINFKNQNPSRDMALMASAVGSHATVDLSSASDRLSCWAIERFFRKNPTILDALHACRSRHIFDGISEVPNYRFLKKYAPQGNATTFPVQSIVYSTCCIAAYLFERKLKCNTKNIMKAAREVRIFGDDLIVPKDCLASLYLILAHLGLRVNMTKTHVNGWFRESCGMDAFKGYNVTPVYINNLRYEVTPESLSSLVDVSNNALKAGFFNLSKELTRIVSKLTKLELIPITRSEIGCLSLFSFGPEKYGKTRFNKTLHYLETLGFQVTSRTSRREREDTMNLLQYFIEAPDPNIYWHAGYVVSNRTKLKVRWVRIG